MRRLLLAALLSSSCNLTSITTPMVTGRVNVRALAYQTAQPLQGVRVQVDGRELGQTGADGSVMITLPLYQEVTIGVELAGWRSMVGRVADTITRSGETWTFYLEQL